MPALKSPHAVMAALWLTVLAAALSLSVLAGMNDTLPGDVGLMEWTQAQTALSQRFADAVRAVTDTQVVLVTGAVAVIALWRFGHTTVALFLAVGLIALSRLKSGLKDLVDRPRPPQFAGAILSSFRLGFPSESFPAGHVMSPTLLYGFLLYAVWRLRSPPLVRLYVGWWSALVLLATGPVNVWLGVHWPSDVLGGYLWGLALLLPLVFASELSRRPDG